MSRIFLRGIETLLEYPEHIYFGSRIFLRGIETWQSPTAVQDAGCLEFSLEELKRSRRHSLPYKPSVSNFP